MARPTDDLEWALLDQVDGTSGQNNVVEPPAATKNYGWDYQEKPPRNWDNWFKRTACLWVEYLDTAIGRACTLKVAASDASAETKAHADYVCDGTSDETDINAAITAASTTGGLVLLSEGTFTIDGQITMASNVHVRGMGIGATKVEVDTGIAADITIMMISSKTRISVADLTIDGKATSITQNHVGIEVNGSSHIAIHDVEVMSIDTNGSDGYGIEINASTYVFLNSVEVTSCQVGVYTTGTCEGVEMVQVIAYDNTTFGFDLAGDYSTMISCTGRANGNSGLSLGGNFCRVLGCIFRSNTTGDGISLSGSYNLISGCTIDHNDYHGIATTAATDNHICDCLIIQNSQGTHDTYDGIYISDSSSDWNTITDCKIRKGTSSPQQRYGINLAGSADNYVYGNDLVGAGNTGNTSATGRTIPEWVAAGADSSSTNNVQDDITKANRVA